ncbi:hypothetical protein FQN55_000949 [Onygenales sp. PD_40]|nr:hypothetical protein FQN55_000949 [Onygenales sp. PD_40]KAK2782200.1 hypothetical protein FQN52_001038 [Onygenales sp. PD_12]
MASAQADSLQITLDWENTPPADLRHTARRRKNTCGNGYCITIRLLTEHRRPSPPNETTARRDFLLHRDLHSFIPDSMLASSLARPLLSPPPAVQPVLRPPPVVLAATQLPSFHSPASPAARVCFRYPPAAALAVIPSLCPSLQSSRRGLRDMGSLVDASQISRDGLGIMEEVIPKSEPNPEGSCSSSVSTPEPDGETVIQDAAQRQKRKGGRKPIYATSEERKQRNRQAQAAFRERRTEYIKQLETTIKHNEETLQTLQQSHRSAADECLMLRYKNSLLERILLEKGIDVQAELRLKSGSPNPAPAKPARQPMNQNSPLSRTAMNRQSVNRHKVGMPQKLDQSNISQAHREDSYTMRSPQLQPTPSSHVSSPSTTKSPGFVMQGAMSPTGTDIQPQQQHTPQSLHRPPILPQPGSYNNTHHPITAPPSDHIEPMGPAHSNMPPSSTMNTGRPGSAYYLSPFQKHYDQLGKRTPISPFTPSNGALFILG